MNLFMESFPRRSPQCSFRIRCFSARFFFLFFICMCVFMWTHILVWTQLSFRPLKWGHFSWSRIYSAVHLTVLGAMLRLYCTVYDNMFAIIVRGWQRCSVCVCAKHYMDMHLFSVCLCKCCILKKKGLVVHGCVFVSSYASLQFILGFVYVGQHDLLCVCVCVCVHAYVCPATASPQALSLSVLMCCRMLVNSWNFKQLK